MARVPPQAALLPDGRLHLQHGPIDLIVKVDAGAAEVQAVYGAVTAWFATVLDELVAELPSLRQPCRPGGRHVTGRIACRMQAAVLPHMGFGFITPMAAVAGAVADEAMAILRQAAPLRRAFVNNGGDIALYLAPGEQFRAGLVAGPDHADLFATTTITASDGIGGIATSGWRGRSFSLGIADAVTICAATAAEADAAATVVANAVDLPGHLAIHRVPAASLQPNSDLGSLPVTRDVGPLSPNEAAQALAAGLAVAEGLIRSGRVIRAALHCQGRTRVATGDS